LALLRDMTVSARQLLFGLMSRDGKRIAITDNLGSSIFAGLLVWGREASATEKDPYQLSQWSSGLLTIYLYESLARR
jgi:hypothetical protein